MGRTGEPIDDHCSDCHMQDCIRRELEVPDMPDAKQGKPPLCDECDCEMTRYEQALDTGKDGWYCEECGWSYDDD